MATVLDSIKRYQYIIDKHSHDEHKILKCINKLYHLDVTVQHLQETGVGRTINSLRKESGDVGPAARSLVQKWKEMVAAEESEEDGYQSHETTTYNGHGSGRESDDNGRNDTRSSNTTATLKINGNHSGTKREYHSSEEEDSNMKRSKYSYDDYNKVSSKTKKEEAGKSKQDEPQKASRKEPEYDSRESEASASDESDSSESSVEYSTTKRTDNKESSNHCKSSKQQTCHNNDSEKRDSSSSKKSHHNEKHSEYHSSSSKERHSSEKSLSKDKSHRQDKESSHKHKKPDDKIIIPEKKQKSDSKSSDHKISSKESKSSSKHRMEDNHLYKHDSSEKHKSNSEKHSSKSDKHRSSSQLQNTEKERHKQAEAEISKHKSKDSHSSSSKEKSSSSNKEKSKDKNYPSKDKSGSSSSHKHTSDSKSSSSEHKSKSDKHESRSSEKKSKHRSSSSSDHKTERSSSKTQENVPKKKDHENHEDSDDGIDCGSGASFAEALGMISPAKPKKKLPQLKDIQSPNSSFSNDLSPAALLAPTAKLAPLPALEITALPEISPNYRPRPPPKALLHFTDDEALNAGISSKNQRTKVYSGNKVLGKIPSLYEMCVHILQEHIDALEFTGGVPYNILKPVVDRATPQQLFTLEHYNPYLMEDTDHLWQKFCEKGFRNKQRHEMESWREMYLRCQEEQEHRLKALTANIRITQEAKKAPIKQTKMAYVDTVVKPPRNIARKQALHGTAHASTASPAARVASLASAPNVARVGAVRPSPVATTSSSSSSHKPKKAPLMQKALQFMRGRKR